ncbi:MAG: 3-hydroxybutyrate dehydrogenase [Alphaproteobacteria bacterium]
MLSGKTALVTGSTSGIGLGIARALHANGANIILNGFGDPDEIKGYCDELNATYIPADLTNVDDIHKMFEQIPGGVDILVNNAGTQYVCNIADYPEEKWDLIIDLNLNAAFHCTKAVLKHMAEQKWGRIINIASAHGLVASPFKSAYVAAKHGLVGFTKVTAMETGEQGITCNAICPGYTWTQLVENQIEATAKERGISKEQVIDDVMLKVHATKKFTTIEQLADLTVYLCSEAAANMTGTSLPVDGGWSAH